jgi:hypothetical protein
VTVRDVFLEEKQLKKNCAKEPLPVLRIASKSVENGRSDQYTRKKYQLGAVIHADSSGSGFPSMEAK